MQLAFNNIAKSSPCPRTTEREKKPERTELITDTRGGKKKNPQKTKKPQTVEMIREELTRMRKP